MFSWQRGDETKPEGGSYRLMNGLWPHGKNHTEWHNELYEFMLVFKQETPTCWGNPLDGKDGCLGICGTTAAQNHTFQWRCLERSTLSRLQKIRKESRVAGLKHASQPIRIATFHHGEIHIPSLRQKRKESMLPSRCHGPSRHHQFLHMVVVILDGPRTEND